MAAANHDASAVRLGGVSKYFPGVVALRNVSIDFYAGEVHGLVGENGAGKSTLIKIIAGAYQPDQGQLGLFGQNIADSDPRSHREAGIGIIYQERSIVPELSAAANVFLGRTINWGPLISPRATRRRFKELADRLGAVIDPDAAAGSLSVAAQQLLEIMRAIEEEHRLLILDEPTTALGAPERQRLYAIIKDLRRQGLAIIFISHDLDEVLELCDCITVMRDGERVATRQVAEWSKTTLVGAMLGGTERGRNVSRKQPSIAPALAVTELAIPGIVEGISFTLHKGEILGLAGLIGSGRTEILRALAGVDRGAEGQIEIEGRAKPWPANVTQALDYGIALAPEDRRRQGLILGLSGADNVTLTDLGATTTAGFVSARRRMREAVSVMQNLAFNVARLKAPAETLSGGNQQKLVIGKWLYRRPKVLLLDEPTQGIDVGAKAEIFDVVAELANGGTSIIFVSSEFEEVVDIADRILVIGGGRTLALLQRGDASVKRILDLLFGVEVVS
jgi:ABC-type sugar transport system ATPase subunit